MAREHRFRKHHQGTTLIELVMTIVIISVAIAGVVGAFSLIAGRSADPLNQTRAVALSQRYMDEILAKKFAEDSPVGGGAVASCTVAVIESDESRSTWDDVDDYNEVNDETPSDYWNSSVDDELGYEQFKVDVSVNCVDDPLTKLGVDVVAKRIDITITDPSNNTYLFSAYRGNF